LGEVHDWAPAEHAPEDAKLNASENLEDSVKTSRSARLCLSSL